MANPDLKSMSVAELDDLIEAAAEQRAATREQRRLALKTEIEGKLKAEGFTAHEVLGAKVKGKPITLPAKYADPDDEALTWSGKGRTPAWLQSRLDGGAALTDFLINGAE